MAKDTVLPAKKRRRLLAQKASSLAEVGGQYLEQGRWGEALECLNAAGASAGLKNLAAQTLEAGDLFTWRRALEALGQTPSHQDLEQIKAKAEALGKSTFARAVEALLEPPVEAKP